jgi:hypothetical protein
MMQYTFRNDHNAAKFHRTLGKLGHLDDGRTAASARRLDTPDKTRIEASTFRKAVRCSILLMWPQVYAHP